MKLEDKELARRLVKLGIVIGFIMILPHLGMYMFMIIPYAILSLPALIVLAIIWRFIK